jgi:hypothetical protein
MTGHDLARRLLELPDKVVVFNGDNVGHLVWMEMGELVYKSKVFAYHHPDLWGRSPKSEECFNKLRKVNVIKLVGSWLYDRSKHKTGHQLAHRLMKFPDDVVVGNYREVPSYTPLNEVVLRIMGVRLETCGEREDFGKFVEYAYKPEEDTKHYATDLEKWEELEKVEVISIEQGSK